MRSIYELEETADSSRMSEVAEGETKCVRSPDGGRIVGRAKTKSVRSPDGGRIVGRAKKRCVLSPDGGRIVGRAKKSALDPQTAKESSDDLSRREK